MKNYLLLSFALLNACGGGGGNGGSTSQIAVPLPTANINSSAGSTYQGDNVTLTWSSTNATTCISSGAWSNTISTSGSQSVPVSALGSNIFTLTCGTGSQTSIVQATVTTTVKPYFVEVPNAFPDPGYIYALANPGSVNATHIGGIVFATPIKKLPNGSSGIIFSAGASNPDPTQACFGKLYIFEYKNGVFNDVTTSMLDGVNSLNGFPSVTAVDDINGDGITDFVSGVTQDCGRTTQTNSNALVGAQPVALVSNAQTGKYKIIHFSYPDGWENVRILTENDGSKSIALGGYNFSNAQNGGTYKYKFNGTTFVAVNNDFPHPNAQGFTIYSASGEPGFSALIQPGESSAVESFIKDANGNWTSGGTINSSYPVLGYSVYTGWTGGFSTVPIINLGGNAVIGAPNRGLIVTNSCKIRISPTSDYSVLLMLPVNVISNYIPGEPIADSMMSTGRISPGVKWLGASISKGVLTQSDPVIINELTTNNGGGFNQFDCRDVNGDGYDDLVGYALWQGDSNTNAFPLIYLNQKNGTFKRTTVGDTMSFRTGVQANQHTSMMTDIDGDGIEDLIIFPGSPGGASLTGSMKFYKGLKKLDK